MTITFWDRVRAKERFILYFTVKKKKKKSDVLFLTIVLFFLNVNFSFDVICAV